MAIDTIRLERESSLTELTGGVVDVSGVAADRLGTLVAEGCAGTVHLERRAGRTYLVTAD